MDYFQYFDLNPTFQIDLNELRKRYYQKAKNFIRILVQIIL